MTPSNLAIERALTGIELPHDEPVRCADCGARLREGQPITASANCHGDVWRYGQIWCAGCAPRPWKHDAADVLVEGSLAVVSDVRRQRHYSVVIDATVASGDRPTTNSHVIRGP